MRIMAISDTESTALLYVHGNHDEKYDQTPPEECICIDDKIYVHEGIRILGLGGCMPYKPGKYMYTEKEMKRRLLHIKHQLIFYHGFDILLTHAPAQGLGDGDDHAHQGYEVFLKLLDKYQPKYMVHGHMHLQYDHSLKRIPGNIKFLFRDSLKIYYVGF